MHDDGGLQTCGERYLAVADRGGGIAPFPAIRLRQIELVKPTRSCHSLVYSMTSSARARIEGGTVRPSVSAVLRLTTSSNLSGCWTGRSAGFSPLRILPA